MNQQYRPNLYLNLYLLPSNFRVVSAKENVILNVNLAAACQKVVVD